ncbi:DNA polymerase delta small subunit [Dichanthelium oligosanthes]|uniref:DNA polymerase delta small subunit n=1 Tax=Dichanthelium oligosanthes TaxID=888268 RepID=A0A1E5VA83_9POAL|nr:DNA polymerase delta small subunit [Dichanthelium oligosanthes]
MPVPVPMERKQAAYSNLDERYAIQGEKYQGQQYSHIYFTRLHHMRNLLHALAPSWKPQLPVTTVLGLEKGKDCIVVGTLYKHMKLKPSILDEYSKERSAVPLVKPHNFMHPDDHLILEDESGRVTLAGAIPPAAFVTGVVVALHGKETSVGNFLVEDVLEAGLPPQTALSSADEDKYVVFVSGLSVGSGTFNPLQFQLLIDHITGHLGDENEQTIASNIVRVVVAGNSVHISPRFVNGQTVASKDQSWIAEPIKELDIMLTQIVASLPVDIMPGCQDPANFSLPQQPLHRCLFSGASTYNTFSSCSNPHQFELDSVQFLGTSGQNIDDLYKYSDAKDKLEFMERTLRWRHLAPTAPNSLGNYSSPAQSGMPTVKIVGSPSSHIYLFIQDAIHTQTRILSLLKVAHTSTLLGIKINMKLDCWKVVLHVKLCMFFEHPTYPPCYPGPEKQKVRLISIPRFSESGVAVMVCTVMHDYFFIQFNLRNLECSTLSFSTSFDA